MRHVLDDALQSHLGQLLLRQLEILRADAAILSTGVVISVASWLVLHRLWVTIPVTAVVVGWWLLFLVLVPAAYRSELSQQG